MSKYEETKDRKIGSIRLGKVRMSSKLKSYILRLNLSSCTVYEVEPKVVFRDETKPS